MKRIKRMLVSLLTILLVFGMFSQLKVLTSNVSANSDVIVQKAKQKIGCNYEWGAGRSSNPTTFDCSGLVYYCYKSFCSPIKLHSDCAADQAKALLNGGYDSNNLSKANMIFYAMKTDGKWKQPDRFMHVSHVAIVYSNSKIIHAVPAGVSYSDIDYCKSSRVYQAKWCRS